MEYGLSLIAVIAIMGGLIAFLGDKIGSKVGKKRIRLFGLRPHNTSILVTVITGILIAAATIGITAILSNNVRTALFGMEKLKVEMKQLTDEIQSKNHLLEMNKKLLASKTAELTSLSGEVEETRLQLNDAQLQQQIMAGKLESAEKAFKKAQENLNKSQDEIKSLEETKKELTTYVTNLEDVRKRLEESVISLREGEVVFRVGQVLSGAIVKPGLMAEQYEFTLASILKDTNKLVAAKLKEKEDKTYIYVSTENIKSLAKLLSEAKGPMLVRIISAGNSIYGEPIVATLVAQPYVEVYKKGDVVYQKTVTGGESPENTVLEFLKEVNRVATEKGVLQNGTGQVGSLDGSELYEVIDRVRNEKGKVLLKAVTSADVYTEGPLRIHIEIH